MELNERINFLKELRDFYKSLPEDEPAHVKFMPMEVMIELFEKIDIKDYSIDDIVSAFLDSDMNKKVIEDFDFSKDELEFFFWGMWATIGIIKWEEKIIDSNKKMLEESLKIKQELEEIKAEKDKREKEDQIEWLKAEINIRIYKDK